MASLSDAHRHELRRCAKYHDAVTAHMVECMARDESKPERFKRWRNAKHRHRRWAGLLRHIANARNEG